VTTTRQATTALDIGHQWVAAWNSPTPEPFVDLYADDGEYVDITFGIRRRGHDLIRLHHQNWRAAIPDFVMSLDKAHVGDMFVVVEGVGRGTFSGRDLGEGLIKATMRPFVGRTAAVLALTPSLKIQSCHEYYDRSLMPGGGKAPFGQI